MRIIDWSSDVCSSDLAFGAQQHRQPAALASGHEIAAGWFTVRLHLGFDHKVLDQPLVLDRSGQRLDGGIHMRHLAGIARGLLELDWKVGGEAKRGSGRWDIGGGGLYIKKKNIQ